MVEELLGGQDPLGDGRRRTGSILKLVQCELDLGRARPRKDSSSAVSSRAAASREVRATRAPHPTDVGAEPSQTLERRKTGDKTNRQTTVRNRETIR